MMGGGGRGGSKCPTPIFICENNRKSNKIMQKEKFLSDSFEDRAIFHVIQLSYDRGGGEALCATHSFFIFLLKISPRPNP